MVNKSNIRVLAITLLFTSGIIATVITITIKKPEIMASTVSTAVAAPLPEFENWPDTSMFEFLVIKDSVMHAYSNNATDKTFEIDSDRVLLVDNGEFWMYFSPYAVSEPKHHMKQICGKVYTGMKLTFEQYEAINDYFNRKAIP